MNALRNAKNIVFVGDSLPDTDIYMQYFLRAGIGPNVNLNKIIVFNPVLFKPGEQNDAMRTRFGNCFSPQLQNRIDFNPPLNSAFLETGDVGKFKHFVRSITTDDGLFFQ